ncbi:MAG: glycosyltransferase family 4 protein [Anaerolineae bacterium]|nr:glycosyltransferase family 4 protein [Anaerolineae bacterium]
MRIGIDYTAAVRQHAGIGRYTRELVAALAKLDHSNSYILFSAGRPERTTWPKNFRLRSLPLSDRHLAILWQRLRLPLPIECFLGKIDLYHSPDFVLPPVLCARTLLTVHDLSFLRHPECFPAPLLEYLTQAVPRSVQRADLILADSQSTRQDIIELLHIPPERVAVIYAGVDPRFQPSRQDPSAEKVLQRYNIPRPYLLGLGTLQPRKNFARLIKAYHLLRQRWHIPHHLVIGGTRGWLDEEIDQTIQELDLTQEVHLIGFVADEDLPILYSMADLFVFPSLYEGFGIPVLEAMACGTPVVTSSTSSLPEVAGEAALLVPPTDVEALAEAMAKLLEDEELRADLQRKGFLQIKRFTWRKAAQKLLQIYDDLGGKND